MSSKLLKLAGDEISEECKSNPLYYDDELRITSGGKSSFQHIVHLITPSLGFIHRRLEKALVIIDKKFPQSSVAVPAIGIGKQELQKYSIVDYAKTITFT